MSRFNEILETCIKGLIAQGRKSMDNQPIRNCSYRGANGTKCAIGMLITDEYYNSDFEGAVIASNYDPTRCIIPERMAALKEALEKSTDYEYSEGELVVLEYLQETHDESEEYSFVEDLCKEIENGVLMGVLPKVCLEFIK
jgi:hypothetical protein